MALIEGFEFSSENHDHIIYQNLLLFNAVLRYNPMQYSMTCSCGDTQTMDGATREEAVAKLKEMMTEEMIQKHMTEKHPGMPVMSVADCHAMIEQQVVAVA